MAKKLVLTNLTVGVTEAMIRNFLFNQGEIRSVELNPPRDRQQAYAYVTINREQDAANIVRKFNGQPLLGQEISISRMS